MSNRVGTGVDFATFLTRRRRVDSSCCAPASLDTSGPPTTRLRHIPSPGAFRSRRYWAHRRRRLFTSPASRQTGNIPDHTLCESADALAWPVVKPQIRAPAAVANGPSFRWLDGEKPKAFDALPHLRRCGPTPVVRQKLSGRCGNGCASPIGNDVIVEVFAHWRPPMEALRESVDTPRGSSRGASARGHIGRGAWKPPYFDPVP
jgi:hypothetical protein